MSSPLTDPLSNTLQPGRPAANFRRVGPGMVVADVEGDGAREISPFLLVCTFRDVITSDGEQ